MRSFVVAEWLASWLPYCITVLFMLPVALLLFASVATVIITAAAHAHIQVKPRRVISTLTAVNWPIGHSTWLAAILELVAHSLLAKLHT